MTLGWIRPTVDKLSGRLAELGGLDVALRLTLVMLLISRVISGYEWPYLAPLRALAVLGLVVPGWLRSRVLWLLIAGFLTYKSLDNWWSQDNHEFVFTYWCIGVAVGLAVRASTESFATSARLLIGLSFGFAVLWKAGLSPDYLDGSYFHYTLLTDDRFQDVGVLLGGMTEADYQSNIERLSQLHDPSSPATHVHLIGPESVMWLAQALTWWTLIIETVLALAFLWPPGRPAARYRDVPLLVFGATTYLVATVPTFGWTLLTLGIAQCPPERRRTLAAYVAVWVLVLLYGYVPVLALVRQAFSMG